MARLLDALKDSPNALIQIGSVLLIKVDGVPLVRNLTQVELAFMERNPRLHADPAQCLKALQQAADAAQTASASGPGIPPGPVIGR